MKAESSQKTIKIDENLWNELDRWLETSEAKKLGYHSKAQFATEAVKELLEKSKYQKMLKDLKKFYSIEEGFEKEFQDVLQFAIKAIKSKKGQGIASLGVIPKAGI